MLNGTCNRTCLKTSLFQIFRRKLRAVRQFVFHLIHVSGMRNFIRWCIQKFNILPFSCISWLTYSMQKIRNNRRKEIYEICIYYTESNLRFQFVVVEWYTSSSRTYILLVHDISTYGIDKLWNELWLHQKTIPLISEGDHPYDELPGFFTWPKKWERNIFFQPP